MKRDRLTRLAAAVWRSVGILLLLVLIVQGVTVALRNTGNILGQTSLNRHFRFVADHPWLVGFEGYRGQAWPQEYVKAVNDPAHIRFAPYLHWAEAPYNTPSIHNDAHGRRVTWNAKAPRPIRIFMIGGSALWGIGVRDEATIASETSRALHRDSRYPVEISNLAVPGYVSTQEIIALLLALQKGERPDLVVFYDGCNDTTAAFQKGTAGGLLNEDHRQQEFNLLNDAVREHFYREAGRRLMKDLAVLRLYRKFLPSETPPAADPAERARLAEEVERLYAFNLEFVEKLGKAWGFEPLFYWQPILLTKRHFSPYEEKMVAPENHVLRDFFLKSYGRVAQSKRLRSHAQFHDLGTLFEKTAEPMFIDLCHTSEQANRMIAERLAADLLQAIKRRYGTRDSAGDGAFPPAHR